MTTWYRFVFAIIQSLVLLDPAFAASEIRVVSEDGDPIGLGQSYVLTDLNGDLDVYNQETYQVNVEWWDFPSLVFGFIFISADHSSALTPGVYKNAQWTQFGKPILYITGNHHGCGETSGEFEIHEIEFEAGAVSKFAADAIQYCDTNTRALRAQLRINSNIPFDLGPKIEAGGDFTVSPGSQVVLSLDQATSTNGAIESIQWTQSFGVPVTLAASDTAVTTFVAPLSDSEYEALTFLVTATDSIGEVATDTVTVLVGENTTPGFRFFLTSPPNSFIGGGLTFDEEIDPQYLTVRKRLALHEFYYVPPTGQGWHLTVAAPRHEELRLGQFDTAFGDGYQPFDKPVLDFGLTGRGCNESIGEFKVLDIGFTDNLKLERLALDATFLCLAEADPVHIRFRLNSLIPVYSRAPIADAGPDLVALAGDTAVLDGNATQNDTGNIVSFEWSQLSGPAVVLVGAGSSVATFRAPEVGAGQGLAEFLLTVVNDAGYRDMETTRVRILGTNDPKNVILLRVDPGTGLDWITQSSGIELRFDPNNGYIGTAKNRPKVAIVFSQFGPWAFHFSRNGDATNWDSNLVPGIYRNAKRQQAGFPHIDVSAPGRGCNETDGEFEVFEYVEGVDGLPEKFAVDFTQRCDSGAPLHGILRFNSKVPLVQSNAPTPPTTNPTNSAGSGGGGTIEIFLIAFLLVASWKRYRNRQVVAFSSAIEGRSSII